MIELFMKDHTVIRVKNSTHLNTINRDDVKFYSVSLSSSFSEPICMLMSNIDLLFDFDTAKIDLQVCGTTYDTLMGSEFTGEIYLDEFFYMPPMNKTFSGLSGFEDMVAFLFSLNRMVLCNTRIYDAAYTDYELFYYVLSDFSMKIKYTNSSEYVTIVDSVFLSDEVMLYDDGEFLSGLNVIIMVLYKLFGKINSTKPDKELPSGISVADRSGKTSVRPATILSSHQKHLTNNGITWKMKYPSKFKSDDKCYVDLYVTDACLVAPSNILYNLSSKISVLYAMDLNTERDFRFELDSEESRNMMSIYILEKIIFTLSSMYYLRALLTIVGPLRDEGVKFFGVTITMWFGDDGEDIKLVITEDSKNIFESICSIVSLYNSSKLELVAYA